MQAQAAPSAKRKYSWNKIFFDKHNYLLFSAKKKPTERSVECRLTWVVPTINGLKTFLKQELRGDNGYGESVQRSHGSEQYGR